MQTHKFYGGTATIHFDEEKHQFFHYELQERIISVTSITGVIDKSRPLILWAVGLMKDFLVEVVESGKIVGIDHILEASKEHTKRKEKAADIGTQIHDWIEAWIKDEKTEIPKDPKVRNGITAFLEWINQEKLKLQHSEKVVYSKKYHYAGIMDAEGRKNGKLYVIDFKSSKRNKYNNTGFYNEQRYQIAGYRLAREEEMGKKYDGGILVRFDKEDGSFETLFIDQKEYEKDREAFLGALAIKNREKEL